MRSVLSVVFVASLAAAFVGASAQTTPTPASPVTTDAAPTATPPSNGDTVSCRYEKTTGSNFARRVCHTQREWHQMNVDARDTIEKMGDEGARTNTSGLNGGQ